MKISRIIAASLGAAATAVAATPVSKLAAEWLVPSANTPGQVSLVDTATGAVRTAVMTSNGHVSWRQPVATGVAGVTDVCGGLAGSAGESIAVVSPNSNRVMLVDVDSTSPTAVALTNIYGIGPAGVTATANGGVTECLVVSSHNGGSTPGAAEFAADATTAPTVTAQTTSPLVFQRLQPLKDPMASGNQVGFYTATSGAGTATGLLYRSGSSVIRKTKTTYGNGYEFITGVRDINGAGGLPLVLGYHNDTSNAWIVKVNTPIASASFTSTGLAYPFAVSGIVPILDGGAGDLTDGFLAISATGSEARWVRINATGNGFVSTTRSFSAGSGAAITGIIPMPGIGLLKLEGPAAGGPSSSFTAYRWHGSNWVETDSGLLPDIASSGRSFAGLLFYDGDPAVNESARLLGIQEVPDWTRPLTYPAPFPTSVYQETFGSPAAGLVTTSTHAVSPPPGATYVITNQAEKAVSITVLGSASQLLAPDLHINPESGTFSTAFQVTALYDDARQGLYWRDADGGSWQAWNGPLGVGYSRDIEFVLYSPANGAMGPIIQRSYQFSASTAAAQDSDHDGVPDHVEQHLGLNPFGGADNDGDGWSDLDEILANTDPADAGEYPAPGSSAGIIIQGGFRIAAIGRDYAAREAATGSEFSAHDLVGGLLARAAVGPLGTTLPDGGTRGAWLAADTPVPFNRLVELASPLYFDVTTGGRSGRELRAFIGVPTPVEFAPSFTPSGTNLAADATGWIGAARSAAASLPQADARTVIAPPDTAVAVLLEDLTHRALASARTLANPAPELAAFTLFADRESDRTRTPLSSDDFALLDAAGFDFRLAMSLANAARGEMSAAATDIYTLHATRSSFTPGMAMPLDAMRIMLRGGPTPDVYAGRVSTANLSAAVAAYNTAIAAVIQCYRPVETWKIEVLASPPSVGVYRRQSDSAQVVLLDAHGEWFKLEQGLGLRAGTVFSVTGFTDTADVGTYDSMEVVSASLSFAPAASDNDTDGNLLDDEWERFFFGAVGQDPFAKPGASGHTLLQYFLDGIDPRGGEVPAAAAISLSPQQPVFTAAEGGAYTLDFTFPEDYQNRFDFILEKSTTLAARSFVEVPGAVISPRGGDDLRAAVPVTATTTPSGFFRIRVRLK